jgi:hypothetical protein
MADLTDRELTPPPRAPATYHTPARPNAGPLPFVIGALYGGALGVLAGFLTWGI